MNSPRPEVEISLCQDHSAARTRASVTCGLRGEVIGVTMHNQATSNNTRGASGHGELLDHHIKLSHPGRVGPKRGQIASMMQSAAMLPVSRALGVEMPFGTKAIACAVCTFMHMKTMFLSRTQA